MSLRDVFERGFIAGLVSRPLPFRAPIWYNFNGNRLRRLPVWNREVWPYACITVVGQGAVVTQANLRIFAEYEVTDTLIQFPAGLAATSKWTTSVPDPTPWSALTETGEGNQMLEYIVWTNFDLYGADGTLIMAGSEPTVWVDAQWETLFAGEVTTTASQYSNGYEYSGSTETAPLFNENDVIRLTVNDEQYVYTAKNGGGASASIGNEWLGERPDNPTPTVEDDGGTYYLVTGIGLSKYLLFYSRNPGTYSVKIERAL